MRLGALLLAGIAFGDTRPFSFPRDVGSILTKAGCNGALCHGGVKGRGGFKLSLGASDPRQDYEWIVQGGTYEVLTDEVRGPRIPRIDRSQPERSLILQKPTGGVPHGGGIRFRRDSPEYETLLHWIRQGAPYGEEWSAAQLRRLEVVPRMVTLEPGAQLRLRVLAHFSDGAHSDVTRFAQFTAVDRDLISVSGDGTVEARKFGETSVLVRASGGVSSATVGVIRALPTEVTPTEVTPTEVTPTEVTPTEVTLGSANFIDDFVFEKLRRFRIPASGPAGDSEFLRRVSLDLTGTLPPPGRVRDFLADSDPAKRRKLIDTLMATPEFIDYWTYRFDDVFRVAVTANGIVPKWSRMYGEWVRSSIASNKPYDQMARERIAAQGYDGPTRHFLPYDVVGPPGETMAEQVRLFFGRRLDCAQCHNHPYENWTQDQFWGLAAFFGRVFKLGDTGFEYVIFDHPLSQPLGNHEVNGSIEMRHPRTKAVLRPALLDGTPVAAPDHENPRKLLAAWMTSHPYFAEAAVNRMWSYFFGRGIVDPVDDFRSTNPPTHPELLERLAEEFRKSGHDLRALMRWIVTSNTYQMSGRPLEQNAEDRVNYSHARRRALDAEVLLDAICDVTEVPETFTVGIASMARSGGQAPSGTRAVQLREPDLFYSRFLDLYGRPSRLTLPERNINPNLGQALHMMAGPVYHEKILAPHGRLARLLGEGASDRQIMEEFYLAALSRFPEPEELVALELLIRSRADRRVALADFVWALLCSHEFAENH
jgi:hypothetical protein